MDDALVIGSTSNMKKAASNNENSHLLLEDKDDSPVIILERDQNEHSKSHHIAVILEKNMLKGKKSKSDSDLTLENKSSLERDEKVSLNNEKSLDDGNGATRKLQKKSKSKKLLSSLRSLVKFPRRESHSVTLLNPLDLAKSIPHEDSISKSNSVPILSNLIKSINESAVSSGYSMELNEKSNQPIKCIVCLNDEISLKMTWRLRQCGCVFCIDCVRAFVVFKINQGAHNIFCLDSGCPNTGIIQLEEIKELVDVEEFKKFKRSQLNREVELDKNCMWCPTPDCETVCHIGDRSQTHGVECPTCQIKFCPGCQGPLHPGKPCSLQTYITDLDTVKYCPVCSVPIEKMEGCNVIVCTICRHEFCWHCLTDISLDILLTHFSKGPCRNKSGHSRADLYFQRFRVIACLAGFGIVIVTISPLLIIASPFIICGLYAVFHRRQNPDDFDDNFG